ncbi:permease YjgP/YjgQ family protein [uncultured Candidatus Thioglobus sp.]|nr:permease YjgP/YjgQ family protein [uncultured Candidatus Thioglobus sp.]
MKVNFVFKQALNRINTLIARYVMRNVLVFSTVIFLIISLIIFGNQVVLIIKESLKIGILSTDLLPLISFNMIRDIPLILSLSLFLGIILAISKLYKDSEAIVMNSLGLGDKHFMVFIQPVVLSVFVFILFLTTIVVPWSKHQKNTIMSRDENISKFSFIKQGEFQKFKNGNIVFYASKVKDGDKDIHQQMEEIFIYTLVNGKPVITLAKQAEKYTNEANSVYLRLKDGVRYHGFFDDADKKVLNFDQYDLQVVDGKAQVSSEKYNESEGQRMIDLFRSDNPEDQAELQWRLSQPLSVVILSLLAVLLGKTSPRDGKNLGVLLGLGIFILYNNALLIAKSALESGAIPAIIGLWWVHLLMSGLIFLLYVYRHKKISILMRSFLK